MDNTLSILSELRELAEDICREKFDGWDDLPHCYCERGIDPMPTKAGKPRPCRKCKGWGRLTANNKALKSK